MRIKTSFILVIIFIMAAGAVFAQTPHEQLNQMVEQLQKTPNDNALREKIIRLAPTLKPAPALPDTAIAFEGRAQFAFRDAKSEGDFLKAAQEYEKAVAVAPWVPGYYADLCTIYEKAGKFEDAKRHCGFYLIGLTDPAQMTDVKRRIAGLEFGIEKANSPRGRAEAMLAVLRKQYAGPGTKLLICGINLNQYWRCTDAQAQGQNWVDSVNVDAWPKPGVGPVEYKIVGAEGDQIEITLGTHKWPNGQLQVGGFKRGCGKPTNNSDDTNMMMWVNCPGWEYAGMPMNGFIRFMTSNNGAPLIEYIDSRGDDGSYRRAQFILQPNP